MSDISQLGPRGGRAPGERPIVYAQVSTLQPAPSTYTDPLFVVLPHDPQHAIRIVNWPVIHGATLPALGVDVMLGYDNEHNWRVLWWQGEFTPWPDPD